MKNFCVWLTGLPASGKSTIAKELQSLLANLGIRSQILDSDELRKILTPNPTYTIEERDWFYNVLVYFAEVLYKNGVNVIIAATGNKRVHRENARKKIEGFVEVYLKCSLEVCMKRDRKGIYKLALEGKSKTVPGVQDPYEEPLFPELIIDTENSDPKECAEKILDFIKKFYLT